MKPKRTVIFLENVHTIFVSLCVLYFSTYSGWHRDAESLRAWAFEFLPSKVETITWNKFQKILSGKEAWILDFYAPWCGHCQVFRPEFEKVAIVSNYNRAGWIRGTVVDTFHANPGVASLIPSHHNNINNHIIETIN